MKLKLSVSEEEDYCTWTQAAELVLALIQKLDTMPMSPKNQAEWERRRPRAMQTLNLLAEYAEEELPPLDLFG